MLACLLLPHVDEAVLAGLAFQWFSESNLMAAVLLASPLLLPVGAAYLIYLGRRLLHWQGVARAGAALPGSNPRWAKLWGWLHLAGQAFF